MPAYEYNGRKPRIDSTAYVFPNATLIGDVRVGKNTWIGPGAVLRGDYGTIDIGEYTAIEDNCVVHARPDEKTNIGDHVTVGHLSVIHTATVKEWAVIGMGSVISDFAVVGVWSAVGEGAVVKNGGNVPDGAIAVGVPAKQVGTVNDSYKEQWVSYKKRYNDFCSSYSETLTMLD